MTAPAAQTAMERIVVLGCPGSGKSTFARRLSEKTGIPLFHLDNIWWRADRTHISREEFDSRLETLMRGGSWILDGDYSRTYEMRIRAAGTVIFLDYDLETCLSGVSGRLGTQRPDIPWTESEPDPELIELINNYADENRPVILSLLRQYPEKRAVVLSSRAEAERWLEGVGSTEVCGRSYTMLGLLGRGKGGYSYLAAAGNESFVIKQIHHEPCAYYTFGNKLEAELNDYERLLAAGIRIPKLIAVDKEKERLVKEYVPGKTVFDLVAQGAAQGASAEPYLEQVREMAALARAAGLNIDYFPTNFVISDGLLWYVDYECNLYSDEWSFENWGVKYWSRTPEFEEYLRNRKG